MQREPEDLQVQTEPVDLQVHREPVDLQVKREPEYLQRSCGGGLSSMLVGGGNLNSRNDEIDIISEFSELLRRRRTLPKFREFRN